MACRVLLPRLLDDHDWARIEALTAAQEPRTTAPVVGNRDCPITTWTEQFSPAALQRLTNLLGWPPLTQLCCLPPAADDPKNDHKLVALILALCHLLSGVVYLDAPPPEASSTIRGRRLIINNLSATGQPAEHWLVDLRWLTAWRSHPDFTLTPAATR